MTQDNQATSYEALTELAKSAVAQVLERHRCLGESIAVWQNGKVVVLAAHQILPRQGSRFDPA